MRILLENSGIKVEMEISDESTLPDVLEHIEHLLKAVGYCFEGCVDIIQEDKRN